PAAGIAHHDVEVVQTGESSPGEGRLPGKGPRLEADGKAEAPARRQDRFGFDSRAVLDAVGALVEPAGDMRSERACRVEGRSDRRPGVEQAGPDIRAVALEDRRGRR